ncbi:MAG: hypothetical protein KY439_04170 [Actinobacteria bacterium]|nr:hypothetical protein [Actinomycetota bacterium]
MGRQKRAAGALVALLLAASVVFTTGAWACTPQASLNVDRSSAPAGSSVTVLGDRWAQGQAVTIRWNDPEGPVLATAAAPKFSTALTIPSNASPGDYVIVGTQDQGGRARVPFRVTAAAPTTTTAPPTTTARPTTTTTSPSSTTTTAAPQSNASASSSSGGGRTSSSAGSPAPPQQSGGGGGATATPATKSATAIASAPAPGAVSSSSTTSTAAPAGAGPSGRPTAEQAMPPVSAEVTPSAEVADAKVEQGQRLDGARLASGRPADRGPGLLLQLAATGAVLVVAARTTRRIRARGAA